MQRVVHTWTAIHRSGSVLSKAEQGPMPASPLYYTLYSPLSPLLFRVSPPSPLLLSCSHRRRLLHNFHTRTYQKKFKQKTMSYGCWDLLSACNPSIWEIEFCGWFDIDPEYAIILASAWGPRVVRFSKAV